MLERCRWFFFFQAEDGIRDLVRSRGLGDVYKRQDRGSQRGKDVAVRMGDKVLGDLGDSGAVERPLRLSLIHI